MIGRDVSAILLTGLLCASCTVPRGSSSAPGPQQVILQGSETVVIAPVIPPEDLTISDSTLAVFGPLIEQHLSSAGFDLVHEAAYWTLWEHALAQVGGVFDPMSGELDDTRFELARGRLYSDLREIYDADVVLYPEIWIVEAPFANGAASWDGTSETLVGFGTLFMDMLAAIFSAESELPTGTVPALSLVVSGEDMDGREVFWSAGGIQVLEKVGTHPNDIEVIPDESLLLDAERNRKAVELALSPLYGQS